LPGRRGRRRARNPARRQTCRRASYLPRSDAPSRSDELVQLELTRIPVAVLIDPGLLVLQGHGDDSRVAVGGCGVALADRDLVPELEVRALVQLSRVQKDDLFLVQVRRGDPTGEVSGHGVAADTVGRLDFLLDAVQLVLIQIPGVGE